jgi:HSP90 family molecular chaperone
MILQKYRGYGTNESDTATLSYVNQTIHHYEKIVQEKQVVLDQGQQRIIDEKTLVVDYTTYLTLVASKRRAVSIYEHESNINEERRHIYLLDLHYTQIIKEQHPYVFEEGVFIR